MRIISGIYKSRIIKDPRSKRTHPMGERIRGALFNTLGDINGLTVLDAYAGTGAIAIEALSRGASKVYAVDMNPDTFEILKENRDLITDDEYMVVYRSNVKSWLKNQDLEFDIVIADPPYDNIGMNAIDECAEHVAVDGLLVLSLPVSENIEFKKMKLLDEKRYGTAKLLFYRRVK